MPDWIVCGWYTDTYRHWAQRLVGNLEARQVPYDIIEVPYVGTWEGATLSKPAQLLAAMERHPGKTIILLDVDCRVEGDLAPLAVVPGDIALRFAIKARKGRAIILRVHSGTIVAKQTPRAMKFIKAWQLLSEQAPVGEDDEATLAQTIVMTPDVPVSQLDRKWFSTAGSPSPHAAICHDWASRDVQKISRLRRFLHRHLPL